MPPLWCRLHDQRSIARRLQNLPVGHLDRLMSPRLPVQDKKFATVFCVYAPTLHVEIGVKEAFYHNLLNLLRQADSKKQFPYLERLQRKSVTRLRTVERSRKETRNWQLR